MEIDVGAARCGVAPGPDAVALAQLIAASRHLIFGGLQAYQGSAQHKRTPAERAAADRRRRSRAPAAPSSNCASRAWNARSSAAAAPARSRWRPASGVYTEIQAGSYVFMDADYARNLDEAGAPVATFRHALFVLSTVMSAPRPGIAVLDAGHKAVAVDSGLPLVWQRPDIRYVGASDEHGKLDCRPARRRAPKLGEKLRLVPGHCDPTVDRYDWYVGVRNGRVECLWPVAARGGMS